MRKCSLNQIQGNDTVLTTRKSYIKNIHLVLILNKSIIYFLYSFLYKLLH